MNKNLFITFLKRQKKKIQIYSEYFHDAKLYSEKYIETSELNGNYKYRIMLLVHSIEKGLCMPNARPFGHQKAHKLMMLLKSESENAYSEFEYNLGISILHSWIDAFDAHAWPKNKEVIEVEEYIKDKAKLYDAGTKEFLSTAQHGLSENFTDIMLSRHSVRDFQPLEITQEDLDYSVRLFLEAPTACNRQMCKIYYIKNNELRDLLSKTIIGISGVNKSTANYFVITYDISAFDYSGERNQGYLNAGLVAMNFANGLHYRGIGSCFLQWANNNKQDTSIRKDLGIPMSERIAVVLVL